MTSRRMMAGVFAIAATLTVSTAQSQTYKPDWATKVVLPSAGADITKQFTIQAGTMSGALSWRLPINAGGAGYVLTTDGSASGILSWTDPATGVTLTGDANGPAGSNTVSSYNNGTTFGDMAHEVSSSVSITGGSITGLTSLSATTITGDLTGNVTGDVTGNLTGNVTGDVLGDLTGNVTGNVTGNLSGNVTGGTGSFTGLSATGVVDFSGATSLTLPAGSVGLSSLALTNGHIAVGDISGHAADVAMSGDASISNAGLVTVSKYNNGTSFGTMAAENSSGVSITGGSITGTSISGSTGSFTGGLTSTTSSNSVGLTITNAGTGNDVTGSSWSVSHLGVITARGLDAGSFTITTTGTVSGGTGSFTTLNASGNETVTGTASIDAAPSTGGTNVIGNSTSSTTLNGSVTFGGTVTLPAGSVSAGSLGLTSAHVFVGNASGNAADVAMSGDAAIDNTGLVTVSKYNNGTSFGTMAAENSSGVSITGGSITGTSISGSTGSFTTLSASGNETVTGTASIDASPSTGGTNVIGNATSSTTLNGSVTFGGTVTLPAGSVSASSLGLTSAHVFVGDISGHAADVAMSGDASISNAGLVTVSKYNNGTSFGSMAAENSSSVAITGGSITGVTISGGSLSVGQAAQALAAGQTDDLALDATKSSYLLTPANTATLTGFATGAAGRMVVLVNATSFGITLKSAFGSTAINQLNLPAGADIILGQGGTATFIYDGTANNWRLISAQ